MFLILLFYSLLAFLTVFGKKALTVFCPTQVVALRFWGAGVIFLGYALYKKEVSLQHIYRDRYLFLGLIVLSFGSDFSRFEGLRFIPASYSALLTTTSPLLAATLSYFFFNETLSRLKIVSIFMGVLGILPLLIHNMSLTTAPADQVLLGWGYACSFLSASGFVLTGFIIKELSKRGHSIFSMLAVVLLGAGTIALFSNSTSCVEFWSLLMDNLRHIPIIVGTTLVMWPLYTYLLHFYSINVVTFMQLSSPILTTLLLCLLGVYELSWAFVISFVIVSLSFVLFYVKVPKKNRVNESSL